MLFSVHCGEVHAIAWSNVDTAILKFFHAVNVSEQASRDSGNSSVNRFLCNLIPQTSVPVIKSLCRFDLSAVT